MQKLKLLSFRSRFAVNLVILFVTARSRVALCAA